MKIVIIDALGKVRAPKAIESMCLLLQTEQDATIRSQIALYLWRNNALDARELLQYESFVSFCEDDEKKIAKQLLLFAFDNNDTEIVDRAIKHTQIGPPFLKGLLFHFPSTDAARRPLVFLGVRKASGVIDYLNSIYLKFPSLEIIDSLPNEDRLEIVIILGNMAASIAALGGSSATEKMLKKFYELKQIHGWSTDKLSYLSHNDADDRVRKAANYNYDKAWKA